MKRVRAMALAALCSFSMAIAWSHPGGHGDPRDPKYNVPIEPTAMEQAHGRAGDPGRASRTVSIDMPGEARCASTPLAVKKGEFAIACAPSGQYSAAGLVKVVVSP